MRKKTTQELEEVLSGTHPEDTSSFMDENADELISSDRSFCNYFKELLIRKKMSQQQLFIEADIPEGYGYKLLSEQKRTRQRDVIIRLCYAAHFTLDETQKALKIYGLPVLYARQPRDAALIIVFNSRPGGIAEIDAYLSENGLEPLRECGIPE